MESEVTKTSRAT